MKQSSLRDLHMKKQLRVVAFLKEMEDAIPWHEILNALKPYYKTGEGGRPPHPLERMLRIHFLQLWYNLSDPAVEEALYDRSSFQQFIGLDGFTMIPPDETAICRFRHFLEENQLADVIFKTVNAHLDKKGLVLKSGTIVDATLLDAPVSKKNEAHTRDPEMSSTKRTTSGILGQKVILGFKPTASRSFIRWHLRLPKKRILTGWTAYYTGKNRRYLGILAIRSVRTKKWHGQWMCIMGCMIVVRGIIRCRRVRRRETSVTVV